MTRALVVDDTALNLKLVAALLRANSFDVDTAESAEEANDKLAAKPFDVLLLDLRLPGMDGLELARLLRADPKHRALVIVAVTANAMKTDEAAALQAGCDAFVTKPIDTRALVPMLRRLTRGS
ncbi:MAG TPA: response regulator [Kofleriaceae bacterium]|jgi:CheY-like chemotaxis protein